MQFVIVAAIIFFVIEKAGIIDSKKFINDNLSYVQFLKESDYEFYAKAKYGYDVDIDLLFTTRIRNTFLIMVCGIFFTIKTLSIISIMIVLVVGFFLFKTSYNKLKKYYIAHLNYIDKILPFYLKNLEILVQHYTVPIAIAKSIDTAPEIFKPGLNSLIKKINSGDNTVDPYMDFAKEYPVRDSMRMMRLLYRLGLGSVENKHEQLMLLSKSVSSLQNKSREMRYAARLEKIEKNTMYMLYTTGGLCVVLIILSMAMSMMG